MIKMVNVASAVNIRFGLYAQPEESGPVDYLQARQFSDDGRMILQTDQYIKIEKKDEVHLLKDGDVLFVGKGNKLFSWCFESTGRPTIASSIFFVLRPDQHIIYPQYLAAILNAPQSKAVFNQIGGGTNIFSIRKSELGAFQLPLLPMQQQKRIAALTTLHRQEIELAQVIITQKQNLYSAIISKLIK